MDQTTRELNRGGVGDPVMPAANRTSEQIRSDIERRRSDMDYLADAIRDRLSPGKIANEVKRGMKSRSSRFVFSAVSSLREHPIPWLVMGAGVLALLEETRESKNVDRPRYAGASQRRKESTGRAAATPARRSSPPSKVPSTSGAARPSGRACRRRACNRRTASLAARAPRAGARRAAPRRRNDRPRVSFPVPDARQPGVAGRQPPPSRVETPIHSSRPALSEYNLHWPTSCCARNGH